MAHIITSDRNEIWARDLCHSTALVEAAKNLAPSNIKGHGKVPYQKPWLKSMVNGVHLRIAQCINTMCGVNSTSMRYGSERERKRRLGRIQCCPQNKESRVVLDSKIKGILWGFST